MQLDILDSIYTANTGQVRELVETLEEDTRNRLYEGVWDLAGRPPGDDRQWGKHHCFDDMQRLAEATEAVATDHFRLLSRQEQVVACVGNTLMNQVADEERLSFEDSIDVWAACANYGEDRDEAARRIKHAYNDPTQTRLDLSRLYLLTLPNAIGKLTSLQELHLVENRLSTLPVSIGNLKNLQELNLIDNEFRVLPASICNLTGLQELYLSQNRLITLPASIGNLSALRWLTVTSNELQDLPASIGNLTSLQELDLTYNQLGVLPDSIGSLTALQELHLTNNRLSALPDSIGSLSALTKLRVNHNRIQALPDSTCSLTALQELYVSNNELHDLPVSIGNLTGLQNLHLSLNRLHDLPVSIGNLSDLQILGLARNELSTIPESMLALRGDCRVVISHNPINERVLDRLAEHTRQDDYRGPSFHFNMEHTATFNHLTLEQNLEGLAKLTKGDVPDCSSFSDDLKDKLNKFLNRLCDVKVFQNESTKAALASTILDSIELAVRDENFRNTTFALTIEQALGTCGDRVALYILYLEINQKVAACDRNDPLTLMHLLVNGVWALSLLEKIAGNVVKSKALVDPIETYLAFPVKLKERLNIPHSMDQMLFFRFSGVTEQNLSDAETFVKEHTENEEAKHAFLIEQPAWLECLESAFPAAYKEALEAHNQELESCTEVEEYKSTQQAYNSHLIELSKSVIAPTKQRVRK